MRTIIYHNPRCSKSRETLALLNARGIEPEIVDYLKTPPDAATIADLVKRLGIAPRALLRKGEAPYQALGLDDPETSDAEIIAAMAAHPVLIERPIVVHGRRAALGRPPQNVLAILG
ncbi:MAG: arsenate reductase (glutaredoxin) [Gammaproteobacteria bacterium]|nr:arsenate reductase (glutaredoxin) [Gammaproteobacteria bacterium]